MTFEVVTASTVVENEILVCCINSSDEWDRISTFKNISPQILKLLQ